MSDLAEYELMNAYRQIDRLKNNLEKAEKALEFYADPEHWTIAYIEGNLLDFGAIARKYFEQCHEKNK